jgi:hypothetical protein
MGYLPYVAGWNRLTSSGQVSDTGVSVIICGYSIESLGAAAEPYFINGASTGTIVFRGDSSQGSAGTARTIDLPTYGITFANGCYVSFDSSTAAVTVFYSLNI